MGIGDISQPVHVVSGATLSSRFDDRDEMVPQSGPARPTKASASYRRTHQIKAEYASSGRSVAPVSDHECAASEGGYVRAAENVDLNLPSEEVRRHSTQRTRFQSPVSCEVGWHDM